MSNPYRFVTHFWSWLARFKLGAHFLDLGGLLFELRRENLHPFLLQGDCRFQVSDTGLLFLDFFVLFEELVEQHHVHRIVAHGANLTVFVVHDQIRIYLGYVFRNQTKLRRVLGFFGVSAFL